jgi:hypothetical protein
MNAKDEAVYIHENLEKIGIKTEVRMMSSKEIDPILKKGEFNIAISGHGAIVQPRKLYTFLPVYALYHPLMWEVYDPDKLDTWFYTKDGIAVGIPIAQNKLIVLFDPWRYDANEDGIIDESEVDDATQDYDDGKITLEQLDMVSNLYYP